MCEDSHLCGVQQCHEPAGNYPSTKSTQRCSTRSPRKVTFSQSQPTTIRPDLNNFSALLRRPQRPDSSTMAQLHVSTVRRPPPAGRQTRTISPHILTGLEFTHPEPASRPLISRYIFSSQIGPRSPIFQDIFSCSALPIY